ncbi:MAG: sigma-54-dependent Fis family transcriptional regulator [Chlamydiae bacterium]|nr:sigma-54-dependent Fis family transcriptional regulator [Chlamydiota bacterium]MBI3277564.1 sigma-54-dependent Fis family transcriptional regulator [Chlamydiota bacterium]
MSFKILIVDDDESIRYSVSRMLSEEGYKTFCASSGKEALEMTLASLPDTVLMDIRMGTTSGLETLRELKKADEKLPVILMTAFGTTQTAIEAMKRGAFDYILKPFEPAELKDLIQKAIHARVSMHQKVIFESGRTVNLEQDLIVGSSKKMQEVYKMIGQIAPKDVSVLIRGESGTGKELVARAIYHHSGRKEKPFLPINCAAIPEALLESELFGHEKGAFTGASAQRIGKFEQCDEGTIFLDEIGDLAPSTQAKFLRVLQEKEFQRVGGIATIRVNVRVIAATNKNLEEAIQKNEFREDLFYRLNTITIWLPPLREKKDDVSELCQYFLKRFSLEFNKEVQGIHTAALKALIHYPWPGNIRELENTLKRAVITTKGNLILLEDIQMTEPSSISSKGSVTKGNLQAIAQSILDIILEVQARGEQGEIMHHIEKELIKLALKQTQGNQLKAAQILGMNRSTLRKKIEAYKIIKEIVVDEKP